jgi:hypothetical protein
VQNFCTDLLVKDSHEALLAREQLNFQEDRKTWIKSLKSAEAGRWLTVKHTSGKFSLTCDQFQAALCPSQDFCPTSDARAGQRDPMTNEVITSQQGARSAHGESRHMTTSGMRSVPSSRRMA